MDRYLGVHRVWVTHLLFLADWAAIFKFSVFEGRFTEATNNVFFFFLLHILKFLFRTSEGLICNPYKEVISYKHLERKKGIWPILKWPFEKIL